MHRNAADQNPFLCKFIRPIIAGDPGYVTRLRGRRDCPASLQFETLDRPGMKTKEQARRSALAGCRRSSGLLDAALRAASAGGDADDLLKCRQKM
jgi:hypothetical protein